MSLTPEQKQTVASWVAAGDNLSAIQKKLSEQLKISMTYMDVRFLVDDLDLSLKDAAPKVDTSDVSKAQSAKPKSPAAKTPPAGASGPAVADQDVPADLEDGELAEDPNAFPEETIPGNVTVEVNKVNLIPGALASGTVTFSDGVTADWIVDNQGRPGFTKVSQPGYRPTPQDGQAFMQELSAALQKQGY
ncbi:hypothetical protein CMV30_01515 [Nibricoccus aquaticus]|uniref:Uncharacterized protein n=1 Tax=Nibricoccus aquaticus TaxID=2576891 RepID=A0A290Q275_9BACT|nr:hypothetical protein [Nibricoccus aquaticus]ATC62749.1 hypothetical protein CMV30_01515 [Nibricoccus aquaticus]